MEGRFLVNRSNGKVMGVCAGLADYSGFDVTLIRVAVIAATLATGPVVPFFYILTGWLAKDGR